MRPSHDRDMERLDLKVIEAGTGRLLRLEDGSTYRLKAGETLPR